MSTTAEKIAVMQAFERGERIQVCNGGMGAWSHECKRPLWNWEHCDYRIAPKPREWYAWVNECGYISDGRCGYSPDWKKIKVREVTE